MNFKNEADVMNAGLRKLGAATTALGIARPDEGFNVTDLAEATTAVIEVLAETMATLRDLLLELETRRSDPLT